MKKIQEVLESGALSGLQAKIINCLLDTGPAFQKQIAEHLAEITTEDTVRKNLNQLAAWDVVTAKVVRDGSNRKKWYAKRTVDLKRLEADSKESRIQTRNTVRRRTKQPEIPTKDELEKAVLELELAEQYFMRKPLMRKIAAWMRDGARR